MLDPKARRFISSKLSDHHISVIDGDRGANYPKAEDLGPKGHCLFLTAKNVGPKGFFFAEKQFIQSAKDAAMGKGRLMRGDIVITTRGTIGNIAWYQENISYENIRVNSGMAIIRNLDENLETEFLYQYLRSTLIHEQIQKFSFGSAQPQLTIEILKRLELQVPPIAEQRKIAEILRTWDEAIEKLEALRAAQLRAADAFRLRIFEEALTSANRTTRARDLFEPISERARPDLPLLAVMQDIGIVRRDALDRRVAMPEGDTSTYKVVRPGDFVISLRSFEGGLEYSDITGLVSPAYTVLRARTALEGTYYRHFFKSRSFVGRLDKLIFGIRDGKQIAFRDFGDMQIPAPPLEDQRNNAESLNLLEQDTALTTKHIDLLTRQKRGLMQKLLTGEWRVNPHG
jgi:type I restriction enzyme S subunit